MCKECHQFAKQIQAFRSQATDLNSMFDKLNQLDENYVDIRSVNAIRNEFGLSEVAQEDLMIYNTPVKMESEDCDDVNEYVDCDLHDKAFIMSISKVVRDEADTNNDILVKNLVVKPDFDENFFK